MRLRVLPTRERVYDGAVSDSAPSVTPSRSLFIGALSVLALSVPFFVFGLAFLDTKARVEFQCQRGGPCTLTRIGWLSKEEPITFTRAEIQGARVERGRSPRGEQQNIYRPVLVTTRGEFPLSHHWVAEEREANRTVISVNRFKNPEAPGFTMWHDNRPQASRLGVMFTVAAVLVLLLGLFLTWRAMRRRRQERAQAAPPAV
ncbi:hypothetical protein ACN28I_29615 [Archangium gephyra]|uniref:hypothetical protein n=1 Tax=Archangium gephyra TaxID=48 RepID=UPI003B7CC051